VFEIQIFDAQLQCFGDTQARAIEQVREETMFSGHESQGLGDLIAAQHDGQSPLNARPPDVGHPGQVRAEHLAVEEQQRRQRLAVRRTRDRALVHQPRQEALDVSAAELSGMA
jgi:hypothetical protein